jgi:hypothetical protein
VFDRSILEWNSAVPIEELTTMEGEDDVWEEIREDVIKYLGLKPNDLSEVGCKPYS